LEKLVAGQLSAHLKSNNVLHPHQGAYQHGKSTSDILLVAVDSITSFLDNGDSVCAAFLDLRKAFDSLDHSILLQRLSNLDLSCTVLNWFKDYLTARYHRVKFNNQYSSWNIMKGGIPQGSALGPLLFLIYMNTLPDVVDDGVLLQYADDTTLICSGRNPVEAANKLNCQLQLISSWLEDNKMQLNVKKSNVMWFSTTRRKKSQPFPNITFDNITLRTTNKQKYLGLVFDSQLRWCDQVANVCKKMSYYVHLVNCHKKELPDAIIKLLMNSLVLSQLYYALPVWGPSLLQCHITRIQQLQNRAVRLIYRLHKYDHITEYYNRLRWLKFPQLIHFNSVCSVFQQYHQYQYHSSRGIPLLPPIQFGNQTCYNTRTAPYFANPIRCQLTFTQRFFRHKATNWWNSLPADLKELHSFGDFHDSAKSLFLSSM